MTTQQVIDLYFKPERGEEVRLISSDSLPEITSAMHSHHEDLFRSGEDVEPLQKKPAVFGPPGEQFQVQGKGTYRIHVRQVKA